LGHSRSNKVTERIKVTQSKEPPGSLIVHTNAEGALVLARWLATWGQVISYMQGM
jgi:hypothetical protein